MRIRSGRAYEDGEGRVWIISHFTFDGAHGFCQRFVPWRDKPFMSHRLFDEHGKPIAGLGQNAHLVMEV